MSKIPGDPHSPSPNAKTNTTNVPTPLPSYPKSNRKAKRSPPQQDDPNRSIAYDQNLHEHPPHHPLQQNHLLLDQATGEESHQPRNKQGKYGTE